jgi:hypothetical protein
MLACIATLIILLPLTAFAANIESLFTPDELDNMGVSLTYTRDGHTVS